MWTWGRCTATARPSTRWRIARRRALPGLAHGRSRRETWRSRRRLETSGTAGGGGRWGDGDSPHGRDTPEEGRRGMATMADEAAQDEAAYTPDQVRARVEELRPWFHNLELMG